MCVGLIGRVVRLADPKKEVCEVDIRGVRREVITAMLEPEKLLIGAYLLINAGLAMEVIDEKDALETLRLQEEMESAFADLPPSAVGSE
jgi:hydrogenase expression/formation protein HypC